MHVVPAHVPFPAAGAEGLGYRSEEALEDVLLLFAGKVLELVIPVVVLLLAVKVHLHVVHVVGIVLLHEDRPVAVRQQDLVLGGVALAASLLRIPSGPYPPLRSPLNLLAQPIA